MKGLLIPGGMALVGVVLGVGAAALVGGGAPEAAPQIAPGVASEAQAAAPDEVPPPPVRGTGTEEDVPSSYVKLDDQFVVPVIEDGRLGGLVTLTLGLQADPEVAVAVLGVRPRLRDALLSVLLDHANSGGFSGRYTEDARMAALRRALHEGAGGILGPGLHGVLVLDVLRQDV